MQVKALKNIIYNGTHFFTNELLTVKDHHVGDLKAKGLVGDVNAQPEPPIPPSQENQTPSDASGALPASENTPTNPNTGEVAGDNQVLPDEAEPNEGNVEDEDDSENTPTNPNTGEVAGDNQVLPDEAEPNEGNVEDEDDSEN